MTRLTPSQFNETFLAPCQPGDTAFHAMLYPRAYPGKLDQDLRQAALAGRPLRLEGPFFELCRELVHRDVHIEWLRVLPTQRLGYSKLAVAAERRVAGAITRATGADMRLIDFDTANEMLDHSGLETNPLTVKYRQGVAEQSPKASFWRIDTPLQVAARISIMHYSGDEFDSHQVTAAPNPETLRYTDFWKQLYDTMPTPGE